MATQGSTETSTRGTGNRGRKGNRGRGGNRGGRLAGAPRQDTKAPAEKQEEVADSTDDKADNKATEATSDADDDAICFICAEPVKYYSVSQCNHRTCHVCGLRLRALYKKLECTFCKEPQPAVIFTSSPDASWSSYTPEMLPYKDAKLAISFETQEMMEDSLILLRFNCPESSCDYIANGWSDLKLHTRASHGKLMCDICIRHKKIFTHEHALYAPNQLPLHLPSLQRGHRPPPKEQIEGGVHPLCEFCRECLFSDDELYSHMREKHEECFVCKRQEVRDQHFRNYEALEQHFTQAHFPCNQPSCKERKFVVFGSLMDLKAHMVEEHGADMSSKDKKAARQIQADFEFEEVSGPGRRGRRDRGDREREREPPPQPGPSRAANTGAAGARRREAFGGNLTAEGSGNGTPNLSRQQSRQDVTASSDVDPALLERHTAFLARVSSLAPNPNNAVPAVKAAVRSYRANESAARDLISTFWNVLDQSMEGTASLVNALVDILDDDEKKNNLLSAWNGFKVERRNEFPSLAPTAVGSEWAGIATGRVLSAKRTTTSRSSSQSSGQLLDRVARAATSSAAIKPGARPANAFPPLQASSSSTQGTPGRSAGQRNTPWASSSATTAAPPPPVIQGPTSVPGPGARTKASAPPTLSKSAFPGLPTNAGLKIPRAAISGNQSLKRITGDVTPPQLAWGSGKNSTNASGVNTPAEPAQDADGPGESTMGGGKGKKGKGKQKQMLFTLGSFPT
ncbi:hypothetical protein QCA50_003439 [Cerrena zonata]|uniref:RING-type E3 ubiquitin transferase n=1 Tax=Cerrena zonata TaxID=2478898 RepID=A0AAW0GM72_9APHY